jgi:hypothetical protein
MAGIRVTKKPAAKTTTGGQKFELLFLESDGSYLQGDNEGAYFYLLDTTRGGVTTHGHPGRGCSALEKTLAGHLQHGATIVTNHVDLYHYLSDELGARFVLGETPVADETLTLIKFSSSDDGFYVPAGLFQKYANDAWHAIMRDANAEVLPDTHCVQWNTIGATSKWSHTAVHYDESGLPVVRCFASLDDARGVRLDEGLAKRAANAEFSYSEFLEVLAGRRPEKKTERKYIEIRAVSIHGLPKSVAAASAHTTLPDGRKVALIARLRVENGKSDAPKSDETTKVALAAGHALCAAAAALRNKTGTLSASTETKLTYTVKPNTLKPSFEAAVSRYPAIYRVPESVFFAPLSGRVTSTIRVLPSPPPDAPMVGRYPMRDLPTLVWTSDEGTQRAAKDLKDILSPGLAIVPNARGWVVVISSSLVEHKLAAHLHDSDVGAFARELMRTGGELNVDIRNVSNRDYGAPKRGVVIHVSEAWIPAGIVDNNLDDAARTRVEQVLAKPPSVAAKTNKNSDHTHFRFVVTLDEAMVAVSRTLLIPLDSDLETLDRAILKSFGWNGEHLSAFRSGRTEVGNSHPEDGGRGMSMPLAAIFNGKRRSLKYTYDFGDHWEHTVRLNGTTWSASNNKFEVIEAIGPDMVDDIGGVYGLWKMVDGYAAWLAAGPEERAEFDYDWVYSNGWTPTTNAWTTTS